MAVDCLGNEIVIRHDTTVELIALLSDQDRGRFRDGGCVYLCVEYCERAVGPTRGVYADSCGATADCEYGWRQDSYRIRVTLTEPDNDGCADPCCDSCPGSGRDPCLLLARIDDVREGRPVLAGRDPPRSTRPLGRYRFTTITGINWQHGGYYTIGQAAEILGTYDDDGGLRVRFSKRCARQLPDPGDRGRSGHRGWPRPSPTPTSWGATSRTGRLKGSLASFAGARHPVNRCRTVTGS